MNSGRSTPGRSADLGAATGLTLAGLVREHAARRPGHPYLHYLGDTVSYGELDERTDRVAAALRAAGVGAGDRVALLDRNGPACLEVMFGAAKCGAVYVPVNWRLAAPEIADILTDADPRVLFLGSEYTGSVDRARHGALTVVEVDSDSGRPRYGGWLDGVEPRDPGVLAEPNDAALLMYTSGTTGRPKGAVLTQSGLLGRMPGHGRLWSYDESSVNLVAMPLFHIGGTGIALEGIVAGATTVLMRDFDPGGALDLISTYRVTNTLLVPAMIQFMLDSPACAGVDWSTMRSLVYGAAPISETLLRRAMETMRCEFVQIYGMTEHSGCAASLPAEAHDPAARPELLRSCGLPLPWVEVAITDPVTGAQLATGEVGEIRIRSSQVMRGYWNQPEQTAAALTPDGWYRTGDAGYQDAEGYLFIQDRVKDMIISGGENIYPAEIENVLMAHPGVRDIAVIGVPHERWGETPKAVVVAEPGAEPDAGELIAYCRERLAGYKCPTSVDIVDALPRNPSGKVLKFVLREPHWRGHDRRVS
ncbi:MAG TPA: long-chain-fatty-acid--CoA ligase [Pseudonocardia sp.]|nr:long-chain-fatty-acid--CoA ligase [Pseudonocardia sp.]